MQQSHFYLIRRFCCPGISCWPFKNSKAVKLYGVFPYFRRPQRELWSKWLQYYWFGLFFISAFKNQAFGLVDNVSLKAIITLYSDLISNLLYSGRILGTKSLVTTTLRVTSTQLKSFSKQLFWDVDEFNLFTVQFRMLYYVVQNVHRFGAIRFFDASSSK